MKIIDKRILGQNRGIKIAKIEVLAPEIAARAKPGQFVVLMVSAQGERIPLTVADKDRNKGTITLIFQETGFTTRLLGKLNKGDSLYALAGPLGQSREIKNYGKLILVGGGVGIAEIYPAAKAFKEAGNFITSILGARSSKLLILQDELRALCDELYLATDDGSCGRKGLVSDILQELLKQGPAAGGYQLVYAVGPIAMMKQVSILAKEAGIKTIVSLNALMVDASGMCGSCRVTIAGETKFSCIDGPEFDGQAVDWEELEKRSRIYAPQERHICKLNEKTSA